MLLIFMNTDLFLLLFFLLAFLFLILAALAGLWFTVRVFQGALIRWRFYGMKAQGIVSTPMSDQQPVLTKTAHYGTILAILRAP
jgi:hypothetical protein